jgi:hypothetical protein
VRSSEGRSAKAIELAVPALAARLAEAHRVSLRELVRKASAA